MYLSISQQRLWSLLKFLLIFNLLAIPLHLILFFEVDFYPLAFIERSQVSFFLQLFGVPHSLQDVVGLPAINVNDNLLAIGEACTSIRSLLAFAALVIASPRSWVDKKRAIVFLPIIYLANVFRIATLAVISLSYPSMFDLIHTLLWREGLVFLMLFLWVYWFSKSDVPIRA